MRVSGHSSLVRAGSALVLVLALAACTPGGQFDPTTLLQSDMFDSKKPLKGQRDPVFPNGVPGTTTGVPAELVKGYQAPPEAENAPPPTPAEEKPKPKPKPKLVRAPAPASKPTQISIGNAKPAPASTPQQSQPAAPSNGQPAWPSPQSAQSPQTAWPAPPPTGPAKQAAQPSQSVWPNPPGPGTATQ